jgi:hypothetical protein
MKYSEEKYYRDLCDDLKHKINILEAKINATKKKLDPVGQEDEDIDNDGEANTSRDRYLANRRKTIKKAMSKKKVVNEENKMISEGLIYGGFPKTKLNKDRE